MAKRMVGDRGQGFGQLRFGRSEGRRGIGYKGICALDRVRDRRSNERVNIVGIGGQRAFVKAARLRRIVRGGSLVEPSQTLKVEIHRVGVGVCSARRPWAAASWAFSVFAKRATISSCMSKRSASGLSNRSAQR